MGRDARNRTTVPRKHVESGYRIGRPPNLATNPVWVSHDFSAIEHAVSLLLFTSYQYLAQVAQAFDQEDDAVLTLMFRGFCFCEANDWTERRLR
jgi:Rad3-related DNA helicase